MLIKFSFKNFKSFRDENCLDMQATVLKEHEYNVANINGERYLKVAAIYGANASGKTNVLDAFDFMKRVILINDDTKNFEKENTLSFMVNDKPIELEVDILAKNNNAYKYGFTIICLLGFTLILFVIPIIIFIIDAILCGKIAKN